MGNKADNGKTECNKIKHGAAKDEKKVPKLRFPEFTGEWEERKLGEVGTTYSGLSGKTKENFGHGNGQFVTYMNVFTNPVGLPEMTEAIEIDDSQNEVRFGDVFFTTSSETPEEVGMSSVWLENVNNTYLNSFCFGYRPTVEFNPYYLAYMLRSSSLRDKITFLAQGISRYNISKNKMMDIEIPIPNIKEQKEIGSFFHTLDRFITRHQQKLEHLEDLKKGMLQKMFPKEGETVPEVRFPGFTGKWERRKLGDCFSERQERSADGELISVTINDGVKKFTELDRHDNSSEDKSKYKCVEIGDIAYNTMRMWQGASGISPYKGILSPAYTVLIPEDGIDSLFFSYVFKLENMLYKFQVNSQGLTSDTWNLKYNAFSGIETMVPSLEEQEKIAAYFRNFDNLITLHKHRLEHLKELKKGLLQQMFV